MSFAHRAAAIGTLILVAVVGVAHGADQTALQSGEDNQWPGYNGGYDATRFSPLTQIDTRNVASLQEVGRLKIPETLSFQCGPGHDVHHDGQEHLRRRCSYRAAEVGAHHRARDADDRHAGARRRLRRWPIVPRDDGRSRPVPRCEDR
jgi:hypothetical protein